MPINTQCHFLSQSVPPPSTSLFCLNHDMYITFTYIIVADSKLICILYRSAGNGPHSITCICAKQESQVLFSWPNVKNDTLTQHEMKNLRNITKYVKFRKVEDIALRSGYKDA